MPYIFDADVCIISITGQVVTRKFSQVFKERTRFEISAANMIYHEAQRMGVYLPTVTFTPTEVTITYQEATRSLIFCLSRTRHSVHVCGVGDEDFNAPDLTLKELHNALPDLIAFLTDIMNEDDLD